MARNKVMKLWTAVVTAFLALCAALGFATTNATTAAAASVPQPQSARTSGPQVTLPWPAHGHRALAQSLPPTMKQRIRAEAHGSSPSCRHRPSPATAAGTPLTHQALRSHAVPRPFEEPTVLLRS
ncbi:hypothetical protein SY2F82_53520 [Streptomyces sp. Y2F8-2]|uniref:DUF6344 domain-containing protein n=1 Tax=Streptomyces sp. Y2F8-2 TaxID=2759675 RepID=UPI00190543A0|nr:DUF6344 domain-containing protein [Streptomyces sp. Y2F8-2]GHK03555.1 hypothetical protein SY2F82_53520 [Streptomyces sp. Y2F8-2]